MLEIIRNNWALVLMAAGVLFFSTGKVNVVDLWRSLVGIVTRKSVVDDRDAMESCGVLCKWLDAIGAPLVDKGTLRDLVRKNLMTVRK